MKETVVKSMTHLAGLLAAFMLAAFTLAACEAPFSPETESDDGGPGLVIKVSNRGVASRAMTSGYAKNGITFYEVIFKKGTGGAATYTRASWYAGQTRRIMVEPGVYDGTSTGQAILLAGTNNATANGGYILLAVGFLTKVNGTGSETSPTTTITTATTDVTFTLIALQAAVSVDADSNAFRITAPTSPTDYRTPTTGTGNIPYATHAENTAERIPYFPVPGDTTGITAEFYIPLLKDRGIGVGTTKLGDLLYFSDGSGTSTGTGYAGSMTAVGVHMEGVLPVLVNNPLVTNVNGTSLSTGKIAMSFATPDPATATGNAAATGGLCMVMFDAMVCGLGPAVPGGLIWHLQGGTSNYLLDSIQGTGNTANTAGGGILLVVGTPSTGPGGGGGSGPGGGFGGILITHTGP